MAKINAIGNKSGDLTIDPGVSGDSFVQLDINGTGEFRVGVDDTDSDKFKISQGSALGTNDTFVMTENGERTMPLQPAFFAYNSSTDSNVTGDGTVYTCDFDTEVFDQGGDFSSDTFTAPVTGKYFFSTLVLLNNITEGSHNDCKLYFSATGGDYRIYHINFVAGTTTAGGNGYLDGGSIVIPMTASDTIVVKAQYSGSTKTVDYIANSRLTSFHGFLIC